MLGVDEHRPELAADAAAPQPRDVGHEGRERRFGAAEGGVRAPGQRQAGGGGREVDRRQIAVKAGTNLPRQVVVAVDERGLLQHARDAFGVRGRRRERRGQQQPDEGGGGAQRPRQERVQSCGLGAGVVPAAGPREQILPPAAGPSCPAGTRSGAAAAFSTGSTIAQAASTSSWRAKCAVSPISAALISRS